MIMKKIWKVWLDQNQMPNNTNIASNSMLPILVEAEKLEEALEKVKNNYPDIDVLSIHLEGNKLL